MGWERQGWCWSSEKKALEQPITKFTLAILVGLAEKEKGEEGALNAIITSQTWLQAGWGRDIEKKSQLMQKNYICLEIHHGFYCLW